MPPATILPIAAQRRPPGIVGNIAIGLALVMAFGVCGCRGRAQRDLYTQKLQQEIRVLEDQLYEADYENGILIQKLRRSPSSRSSASRPAVQPQRKSSSVRQLDAPIPSPVPDVGPDSGSYDMGDDFDNTPPQSDPFQPRGDQPPPAPADPPPVKKSNPPAKPRKTSPEIPDLESMIDPGELVDPGQLMDPGQFNPGPASPRNNRLELPPGRPEPPGPLDLRIDPIEPGEILPPNSLNGSPELPPGKIQLPPGLGMLGGLGSVAGSSPQIVRQTRRIEVDIAATAPVLPSQSSSDPPSNGPKASVSGATTGLAMPLTDGLDLAIRSSDQFGHPIAILSETINPINKLTSSATPAMRPVDDPAQPTSLNVLVLDPQLTGEEAKLGRWDFRPDMIASLRRHSTDPTTIKFPIRWQGKKPSGDTVVVFVQFREGDRDLRCEAEISLQAVPSVAGWVRGKR